MIRTETAEKIVSHYGYVHQLYKTAEELAELGVLVIQDANVPGKAKAEDVLEEMADVYVMLKQLEVIYGFSEKDVDDEINYKVSRTLGRMSDVEW